MKLYHATDQSCVHNIKDNGFIVKASPEHWLGNGVYFYMDYNLAKWWSTKPSKKFGVEIKDSVILTIEKEIDPERALDLRTLNDYLDCIDLFDEFHAEIIKKKFNLLQQKELKQLRCAFFDYVFESCEIDCIIGSFTHRDQKYLDEKKISPLAIFKQFDMPYVETQVCFSTQVINNDISKLRVANEKTT